MEKIKAIKLALKSIGNLEIKKIEKFHMDSRLITENDVFFAISGGNQYVSEVLKKKPALVIYDDENLSINNDRAVLVEDTVKTMQLIANEYRKLLNTIVIGITGTNGKTTTKDFVYSILNGTMKGTKTQGNYNNHIGLPYTILQMEKTDDFAVLEMGMSDFGEISKLCEIAEIDYGIITNIGESHLEFLGTVANVFKAKTEMLNYIGLEKLIVFGDDEYLNKLNCIKVGFSKDSKYRMSEIIEDESGITFKIFEENYFIKMNGSYNAANASLGIALAKELNLTYEQITRGLNKSEISSMRFEKINKENILYINDAYNADPSSMESSLDSFEKLYKGTLKGIVLGDMLELGEGSEGYHRGLKHTLEKMELDFIFLYGNEMNNLYDEFKGSKNVFYFKDKEKIIEKVSLIKEKCTILLKGSRGMRLEEIIK